MKQLAFRLPVDQPADIPQRKEAKKATRCSLCKRIVWQEDTFAGLCPDCTKQHDAQILGDDVG